VNIFIEGRKAKKKLKEASLCLNPDLKTNKNKALIRLLKREV